MIQYTLYQIKDGMIIQSGHCPTKDCLPEKPEGAMFLFDLAANPDLEMIKDGKSVPKIETGENNGRS